MFIGGSATNDGGIGMAAALGAKFFDKNGQGLIPTGGNLGQICSFANINLNAGDLPQVIIASDVNNILTGPSGATMVFGKQKGADGDQLKIL